MKTILFCALTEMFAEYGKRVVPVVDDDGTPTLLQVDGPYTNDGKHYHAVMAKLHNRVVMFRCFDDQVEISTMSAAAPNAPASEDVSYDICDPGLFDHLIGAMRR